MEIGRLGDSLDVGKGEGRGGGLLEGDQATRLMRCSGWIVVVRAVEQLEELNNWTF